MQKIPLWNKQYFTILWSWIEAFEWEKNYYSTSSIKWTKILEPEDIITYKTRPSRANMQPIEGVVCFAKMSQTIKLLKVDEDFAKSSILSTWFSLILPNKNLIDNNYLKYYFFSSGFNSQKDRFSTWTTQVAINNEWIKKITIPMFPIENQHLIVQEIEKQFSCLDEWLASLKRTKENLKKYKASVLKSAVEWKLTEDWRKDYFKDPETSPGWQELLKQILQAKKEKFLAENPWKKYKEPELINPDDLPNIELPEGWEWCNLWQLIIDWPQNWLYKQSSFYWKWNYSILRIDDYQNWWFKDKENLRNIDLTENEKLIYWLDENDYIINRVNSMTHLWKSIIVSKKLLPCVFESNMMRIKFSKSANLKYIQTYLYSIHWINCIQKNAKQAVNQASINQEDVKNTLFPLPPLPEQNEIVKIVESKLSVVEKLEKIVNENICKAENLKQSILKKAFEWKLVKES